MGWFFVIMIVAILFAVWLVRRQARIERDRRAAHEEAQRQAREKRRASAMRASNNIERMSEARDRGEYRPGYKGGTDLSSRSSDVTAYYPVYTPQDDGTTHRSTARHDCDNGSSRDSGSSWGSSSDSGSSSSSSDSGSSGGGGSFD